MSSSPFTPHEMKYLKENFQIVIVDHFYDIALARGDLSWMQKIFEFKVNSYLASFPYGMLPFGTADMVGTHWLFCRKEKGTGTLRPMMGFKTIDNRRANLVRIAFSGLDAVSGTGLEEHKSAVEREIDQAEKNGYLLGYVGSWVVDPSVKEDPFLSKACKKITAAFVMTWVQECDIETVVTFANLRFKVEKFHAYLGMKRLLDKSGEPLPPYQMYAAFDETLSASVLRKGDHSKDALQDVRDIEELWTDRLVIASENSPFVTKEPLKKTA